MKITKYAFFSLRSEEIKATALLYSTNWKQLMKPRYVRRKVHLNCVSYLGFIKLTTPVIYFSPHPSPWMTGTSWPIVLNTVPYLVCNGMVKSNVSIKNYFTHRRYLPLYEYHRIYYTDTVQRITTTEKKQASQKDCPSITVKKQLTNCSCIFTRSYQHSFSTLTKKQ